MPHDGELTLETWTAAVLETIAEIETLIERADELTAGIRANALQVIQAKVTAINTEAEELGGHLTSDAEDLLARVHLTVRQLQQVIRSLVAGEAAKCDEMSCDFPALASGKTPEEKLVDQCFPPDGISDATDAERAEAARIREAGPLGGPTWILWKSQSTGVCLIIEDGIDPPGDFVDIVGKFNVFDEAAKVRDDCRAEVAAAQELLKPKPGEVLTRDREIVIPAFQDNCDPRRYENPLSLFQRGSIIDIENEMFRAPKTLWEKTVRASQKLVGSSDIANHSDVAAAQAAMVLAGVSSTLITGVKQAFGSDCANVRDDLARLIRARATLASVAAVAGDSANEAALPFAYASRAMCPTAFPNGSEATDAYLANAINKSTRNSWWSINNLCAEPMKMVMEAKRSKLVPAELVQLWRRGFFGESETGKKIFEKRLRELGFLHQDEYDGIAELSNQIPPVQDLVRFMVRDAGDDTRPGNVVERFKLDTDFKEKFGPQIKSWAGMQGVNEDYMRMVWRSHWRLPSPLQMNEMLHRLSRLPKGDPNRVVEDDVKTALQMDDFLPDWIPRMIAISFRPLTRIDVRRMFRIGALDVAQVNEAYLQLGYAAPDAKIQTDFVVREKNRGIFQTLAMKLWEDFAITKPEAEKRLLADKFTHQIITDSMADLSNKMDGVWPMKHFSKGLLTRGQVQSLLAKHGIAAAVFGPWLDIAETELRNLPIQLQLRRGLIDAKQAEADLHGFNYRPATVQRLLDDAARDISQHPAQGAYLAGVWTKPEAIAEMAKDGIGGRQAGRMLANAAASQLTEFRRTCAEAMLQRYLHGEFDGNQLRQNLIGTGMDVAIANQWVDRGTCELLAKSKEPTANVLCGWLERGAIVPAEFLRRMEAVGFTPADAAELLVDCIGRIDTKKAKEAAKRAKAEGVAMRRAARAAKLSKKEADRRDKQLATNRDRQRKARQRRRNRILKAADKLRVQEDIDLPEAAELLEAASEDIQRELNLGVDDAIGLLANVVSGRLKKGPADFDERLQAVLEILPGESPEEIFIFA